MDALISELEGAAGAVSGEAQGGAKALLKDG